MKTPVPRSLTGGYYISTSQDLTVQSMSEPVMWAPHPAAFPLHATLAHRLTYPAATLT